MGSRGASSGKSAKNKTVTSMDVWNKADEMAEILMNEENSKISYAKVNRSVAKHPENGIDRVYYSISKFKRSGRKTKDAGIIPLGYYDNNSKKYVPEQKGGHEATNVFDYVKKRTK